MKAVFFTFFLLVISFGVFAVNLSDLGKLCLFSGMSGVVKLDGKPVAGARLVRTASLVSSPKQDETITDENGYFEFPPMYERSVTKYLPQEFVAKQDIVATFDGVEYHVWDGIKRNADENSEARGESLIVECDLTKPEQELIFVESGRYYTLCSWDVEPDKKITSSPFDEGG